MSDPTLRPIRLVVPDSNDIQDGNTSDGAISSAVLTSGEKPTDEQVVTTLIAHNGIPARAAAILGVTIEYVLDVASRNVRLLSSRARARVMLSSYATVLKLDAVLQATAEDMSLDALGRTYTGALAAFSNLAGQFEEKQADDDTDDATSAKSSMIERLEKMGKREEAQRAMQDNEATAS